MQFVATQKLTRQSPRKIRLVANQVKKLSLPDMLRQLAVIERRSTLVLLKTLKQAIANAQNNHGVAFEDLELKELLVNEGPRYRRFRAVSRGQAHGIIKRTSHVRVVLQTKSGVTAKPADKSVTAAPEKKESAVKTATKETNKAALESDTKAEVQAKQKAAVQPSAKVTKAAQSATKRTTANRTTNK